MATLDPVAGFERHYEEIRQQRQRRTLILGALFLIALFVSFNVANFLPEKLANGLPRIGDYFYATLPVLDPANLFADTRTEGSVAYWYFNLPKYLQLLFETINIAIFSTMLGAGLALLLCFAASRNLVRNTWVYFATRRFLEFCRSVPEIVFALILVYALGIGPAAGVLAIAIHTAGALGKMFSEVNENASDKPIEGVRAAGGTWAQEMRYGVLPQVWPNFLSYIWLRLEINIRGASIIGFVGGGGIGQELYYVISFNHYEEVSAIVLLIVLTVTLVDLVSERLRHRAIGRENLA
ncbi:MAG: phosphonate ABC transporter, permease protein PhnE [Pseudomonadota bacterium]